MRPSRGVSADADGSENPITSSVQLSSLLFGHKQSHSHTLYWFHPIGVRKPRCLVTCLTIQPHLRACAREGERFSKQLNQCSPRPYLHKAIVVWVLYKRVTLYHCFYTICSAQLPSEKDQNAFQRNAIEQKISSQALKLIAKGIGKEMKTHTVCHYCTQTSFEAKLPILMWPSNHRNVLISFYNPEMSPFYLAHAIWVSVILELIEIISDSGLINRWLHLVTAKQNDIQNRDNRKQEVLSVH